jgi:hypothetical protein
MHPSRAQAGKTSKAKEIPVPDIDKIPSHYRDYLPLFKTGVTYIRSRRKCRQHIAHGCASACSRGAPALLQSAAGAGACRPAAGASMSRPSADPSCADGGYLTDDFVEYDLDNEDEDYLETSGLVNKIHADKFERMLWRLELACSSATDDALAAAGQQQALPLRPDPLLAGTPCQQLHVLHSRRVALASAPACACACSCDTDCCELALAQVQASRNGSQQQQCPPPTICLEMMLWTCCGEKLAAGPAS